jgi:hypothetical protein
MLFADYIIKTTIYANDMKVNFNHRLGQGHFNYLDTIKPEISKYIRGSKFDPFYDDAVLPAFFELLLTVWDTNENQEDPDPSSETEESSF